MLQISHLIGMDGKVFSEMAGLAKGKGGVRSPADLCSLLQRVPCNSGDEQVLMGQVELSVPELVQSVTGSNWHELYYGARAARRSLVPCVVSLSYLLPLFLWNKLLWMVSCHRGRTWS